MRKLVLSLLFLVLALSGCKSSVLEPAYTTSICFRFTISQKAHVKLTLKNSYNTEVAKLFEQDLRPNYYEYFFYYLNLKEGEYFGIMEAKGLDSDYHEYTSDKILAVRK